MSRRIGGSAGGRRGGEPALELRLEAAHVLIALVVLGLLAGAWWTLSGRREAPGSGMDRPGGAPGDPAGIKDGGDGAEDLTFFDRLGQEAGGEVERVGPYAGLEARAEPGDPRRSATEGPVAGAASQAEPAPRAAAPAPSPSPSASSPGTKDGPDGRYSVQVFAGEPEAAAELGARLEGRGYAVRVVAGEGGLARVRVGPYSSRSEAERAATRLQSAEKLKTWIVPGP